MRLVACRHCGHVQGIGDAGFLAEKLVHCGDPMIMYEVPAKILDPYTGKVITE